MIFLQHLFSSHLHSTLIMKDIMSAYIYGAHISGFLSWQSYQFSLHCLGGPVIGEGLYTLSKTNLFYELLLQVTKKPKVTCSVLDMCWCDLKAYISKCHRFDSYELYIVPLLSLIAGAMSLSSPMLPFPKVIAL